MSVTTEFQTVSPGSEEYLEEIWALKENIRTETGFLRQERHFFRKSYRKATSHILLEDNDAVGFISTQHDGYVLFLGVDPTVQGHGHGKRLLEYAAQTHQSLSCHARVSNDIAIQFYTDHGFELSHTVEQYYENNEDAHYLVRRNTSDKTTWSQWTN